MIILVGEGFVGVDGIVGEGGGGGGGCCCDCSSCEMKDIFKHSSMWRLRSALVAPTAKTSLQMGHWRCS